MKAVRITGRGGPEVFKIEELPSPTPGPDELLVDVEATGLNRADLLQGLGLYPAPPGAPADIPGLEYAGVVAAVGARVSRFRPGDRVMGLTAGGAFAEQLVTHEREAVPTPRSLSSARAAAIPEVFFTAFDALLLQAQLRPGETVLIHAVTSGVGTAASQIASAVGATVLGTGRSQAKLDRCLNESLGLNQALLCTAEPSFAAEVRTATGGRGVDVVLDLVGGPYLREALGAMALRGRLVLVGLLAGPVAELPLSTLLTRRLQLTGTVLRSRPLEEKILVARAFARQLLPWFQTGRLRPVVDTVLPIEEIETALRRLSRNDTFGKLILEWPRR